MTYEEAMNLALERGTLVLRFPNERAAYDFRARCYRWRNQQRKTGQTAYDNIVIRKSKGSRELHYECGVLDVEIVESGPADELLSQAIDLQKELSNHE